MQKMEHKTYIHIHREFDGNEVGSVQLCELAVRTIPLTVVVAVLYHFQEGSAKNDRTYCLIL